MVKYLYEKWKYYFVQNCEEVKRVTFFLNGRNAIVSSCAELIKSDVLIFHSPILLTSSYLPFIHSLFPSPSPPLSVTPTSSPSPPLSPFLPLPPLLPLLALYAFYLIVATCVIMFLSSLFAAMGSISFPCPLVITGSLL